MADELKPCPLCGGVSEVRTIDGERYVRCRNLECDTVGPSRRTPEEAVEAWNRRSPDPKLTEAVALLREGNGQRGLGHSPRCRCWDCRVRAFLAPPPRRAPVTEVDRG